MLNEIKKDAQARMGKSIDALRHTPHPTHAHLEQTLDWIARVRPRRAMR